MRSRHAYLAYFVRRKALFRQQPLEIARPGSFALSDVDEQFQKIEPLGPDRGIVVAGVGDGHARQSRYRFHASASCRIARPENGPLVVGLFRRLPGRVRGGAVRGRPASLFRAIDRRRGRLSPPRAPPRRGWVRRGVSRPEEPVGSPPGPRSLGRCLEPRAAAEDCAPDAPRPLQSPHRPRAPRWSRRPGRRRCARRPSCVSSRRASERSSGCAGRPANASTNMCDEVRLCARLELARASGAASRSGRIL